MSGAGKSAEDEAFAHGDLSPGERLGPSGAGAVGRFVGAGLGAGLGFFVGDGGGFPLGLQQSQMSKRRRAPAGTKASSHGEPSRRRRRHGQPSGLQ